MSMTDLQPALAGWSVEVAIPLAGPVESNKAAPDLDLSKVDGFTSSRFPRWGVHVSSEAKG